MEVATEKGYFIGDANFHNSLREINNAKRSPSNLSSRMHDRQNVHAISFRKYINYSLSRN